MAREMVKLHTSKEEIDTDWRYTPVPTLSKLQFFMRFSNFQVQNQTKAVQNRYLMKYHFSKKLGVICCSTLSHLSIADAKVCVEEKTSAHVICQILLSHRKLLDAGLRFIMSEHTKITSLKNFFLYRQSRADDMIL